MRRPTGITLRITLLGWLVTLLTLAFFVIVLIPEQKREFKLGLESKARGLAVSIRSVVAGAAVSEDYSAVVDQAMQVLSGDIAIDYVVITKNDGFSIVIERSNWRTGSLGAVWRPEIRTATNSIGISPLFGRRVFEYAYPFDYSGIQWGWIHVGLSLDGYDQSVRRAYQSTVLLALFCGLLSLLISLAFAARLVRPIYILQAAVEKVAQGDLSARAEVHSHDEIEQLAKAFNEMAGTIRGRNRILESVSFAATRFLSDGNQDSIRADVLGRLGQAAGAGRAALLSTRLEGGVAKAALECQWLAGPANDSQGWEQFPWQTAQGWVDLLQCGHIVTFRPRGAPSLGTHGGQSTIFVPVVVAGEWWGIVVFDDFGSRQNWSDAVRDSLRAMADMLGSSLARQRVQRALEEAKETLEQRVIERTAELREQIEAKDRAHAELADAQQRLMELSRGAGMAEIATGVLHNVGNVLNSVNVSTSLVSEKIRGSRAGNLVALVRMLEEHEHELPKFLTEDSKGQRVIPYLAKLGNHFVAERDALLLELESLSSHVGHIKQIVSTQQNYASVSGLAEKVELSALVEDALRILEPGLVRHGIRVEKDFEPLPPMVVDKHSILQILLNLLRNAKQAMKGEEAGVRTIQVHIRRLAEDRVALAVEDNGVGLPPENLTRIFRHGFTTKANGHGFGLHSCALAANQMGGSLRAESPGPGQGATLTLELPLKTPESLRRRSV